MCRPRLLLYLLCQTQLRLSWENPPGYAEKPEPSKELAVNPLPPLDEILIQTQVISIPMKVPFRGVSLRETALIQGPAGWGEFAPFLEYGPQESSFWLASALEAAYLPYPQPRRQQIELNATLPAVGPQQVEGVLARYQGQIKEIKVKVADPTLPFERTLAEDKARLQQVRRLLPQARIKIDANAHWKADQALRALREFEEFDLLYVEQPTADLESLAWLRRQLKAEGNPVLIAADESVRKASDPLKVARAQAADLLVLKVAPLGGVRRALEIVEQAQMPVVVSSALESSVGIASGLALAAALPELPFACGLGTVSLLAQDVCSRPLLAQDGQLSVRQVSPDPARLLALQAPKARRDWWLERIRACYRQLAR